MTKFSFTMTDADIVKGIGSVEKTVKRTRDQVHFLATSIGHNWAKSNDAKTATMRASNLLRAIDPSHKQKAVNWFGMHCDLTYDKEADAFSYTKTKVSSDVFQACKAESMFELTKDAAPTPYNFKEELHKFLERAQKHVAKPKEGDEVDMTLLNKIRALTA